MSPLARLLASRGKTVIGSDRSYDCGRNLQFFEELKREGITLVAQDGTAVDSSIDTFVITRAVEDSNPDIKRALELQLPIIKRPLLMAELFKNTENIAVGGTSGKSTTTGMIAHILKQAGKDPTVMNGAVMLNGATNFHNGRDTLAVFEADESDGNNDVIALCPTAVSVLTNISLDHFALHELADMFGRFVEKAGVAAVLNADCESSMALRARHARVITFGRRNDADFTPQKFPISLDIPGEHNIENALAAAAACSALGISGENAVAALKSFKGIKRRLELVGTARGIRVIDDFASNPGKIDAAVKTVQQPNGRTFVIFQPHGFQPTKMMKDGYIESFKTLLRAKDILIMPDIYFAGGSVNVVNGEVIALPKDISSREVIDPVAAAGKSAVYIPNRKDILPFLQNEAKSGDTIIIMGSRDETLSDFSREILKGLQ